MPNIELPIEAEEFLSWMVAEKGRSVNTLAAYRRDLEAYVTWLAARGETIEGRLDAGAGAVRRRAAGERCGHVVDRPATRGDPHAAPLPGAGG